MTPDSLAAIVSRMITPATDPNVQKLVEFIFICTIFLGGPLGIIYAIMERKLLIWLKEEGYIKACLYTIGALMALGVAHVTVYRDLTLFQISSCVPSIIGGISAFKFGGNTAAAKARQLFGPADSGSTSAGDPPQNG